VAGQLGGEGEVAVVGAGPAGLTAAKHLLERGIEPLVLECADDLGGQWNERSPRSAVWPGMRTNTSKTTTAFSDFPVPASYPMFPSAEQVHAYLRAYAERFDVVRRVRTGARVTAVSPTETGWRVAWCDRSGRADEASVAGVVVASGRFARPSYPPSLPPGGPGPRLLHARDYRTRDEFRGLRVLVCGNGDGGLEIACDLAAEDSIEVVSASARPRYVLPKVGWDLPIDWQWFNGFAGLLARGLGRCELAAELTRAAVALGGDPARFGGLAVEADILATGVSQSQAYLTGVAEGRIGVKPGVVGVEREEVRFADGSRQCFDAVVVATGYRSDLSFLSPELRLAPGRGLRALTFASGLRRLAFLGQFAMQGPYLPVLELQARLAAAAWAGEPAHGRLCSPGSHAMRRRSVACHHVIAAELAAELGVAPRLADRPDLAETLLFGPPAPARYRLDGPGARDDAEELFRNAVFEFGPLPEPSRCQLERLASLRGSLGDPELERAAATVLSG
jgi:hypothetical protein